MKTKALMATLAGVCLLLISPLAQAQNSPPGFEGIWQTKEWFGTIANMRIIECEDGPVCVQVVSLSMGDGMEPGYIFMSGLTPQGKDLRRGQMHIPNGPSFQGGVFWLNETQVKLDAFGASEVWERVR